MKSISANLNIMIKAAEKASRALIRDFGEIEKLQVSFKGPTDFVSNADLKAEKIIIEELKKARPYYSIISEEEGSEKNKDENYVESLTNLAGAKKVIFDFFDNVKVNDEDKSIKKNRLELLQMLCRTFDNYINFSNIETK